MSSRKWCSYWHVLVLINFGFKVRYMYRKKWHFQRGHVLDPNFDYIETKSSQSILFLEPRLKYDCSCRAKQLAITFFLPSTNKITCTEHHQQIILHSSCHLERLLVVVTIVITVAFISRTVTQRKMSCHHCWYLCLLHWVIQSVIHLVNSYPDHHRTFQIPRVNSSVLCSSIIFWWWYPMP